MSHLFWLDQERLNRIKHMFPKPRGVARAWIASFAHSNYVSTFSSLDRDLCRNKLRTG